MNPISGPKSSLRLPEERLPEDYPIITRRSPGNIRFKLADFAWICWAKRAIFHRSQPMINRFALPLDPLTG
jgi:hypothetical protein